MVGGTEGAGTRKDTFRDEHAVSEMIDALDGIPVSTVLQKHRLVHLENTRDAQLPL